MITQKTQYTEHLASFCLERGESGDEDMPWVRGEHPLPARATSPAGPSPGQTKGQSCSDLTPMSNLLDVS